MIPSTSFTRRTAGRALVAAAVVAATMTGAGVATAADGAGPAARAVAAPSAERAGHGFVRTDSARTVLPGERIDTGRGNTMWLTADGQHVVVTRDMPDQEQAKRVLDDNFPVGTVNLRTFGDTDGTLFTGAYRGPDTPARVTVEADGKTLEAQVVTLPGRPGWAAYHVDSPAGTGFPGGAELVTAYAADGTVLAQLDLSGWSR
ncbi:hypothetical protein [Streptomyces thermolineatus]